MCQMTQVAVHLYGGMLRTARGSNNKWHVLVFPVAH